MGKQYYCDYCNRTFADGAENRKKHLISMHHQKLRKAHYDSFRDAATVIREELQKKPCRKFAEAGHCEYGAGCKYSHLTATDIHNLQEQARIDETGIYSNQCSSTFDISNVNVEEWLKGVLKKQGEKDPKNLLLSTISNPPLPEILRNVPNLPPSLIPSKPIDMLKENMSTWGR